MEPILKNISKVGIVVKNLSKALDKYYLRYGIGEWNIWEQNPQTMKDQVLGNVKTGYSAYIAHSKIGDTVWELIEPISGNSIYTQFLQKYGEGIHHLGYEVEDINKALGFFADHEIKVMQSANWDGLRTAFLDTNEDLKHTVEIYNIPRDFKYPKPDLQYPDKSVKGASVKPLFKEVRQIGLAVEDIKKTARTYNDKYGVGPWELYKYFSPKTKDMQYDELDIHDQKFTTGAAMIDKIEVELVEPEHGKTVYADFINKYGEGIQHISFIYNCSFEEALKFHKSNGQIVKQSGNINNAIYAYFDTQKDLKFISEYVYIPQNFKMPKSDYSYPE